MAIQLLIADTSDLAIIGLEAIFAEVPRVAVAGVVRGKEELFDRLPELRPDVVLIDHTAEGFGAESVRDGLAIWKRTRFVAITPDPSPVAIVNALRSGVTGYIKKDCGREEIVDAVLQTADGDRFFCGKIVDALERADIRLDRFERQELSCDPVSLTEREVEVVRLIADGLSYTQIADLLELSAHTVTTHRRNVMQKLGVNNTAAVVMYAVKHGLTSPNKFLFNG